MIEAEDKELLHQYANGKKHYAFNLLMRKYQEKVYLQVRRMVIDHDDTNDVVQNTFIKIWNGLDRFNEQSKLYTWIYRIAVNESITFLNKKRTKFFIPLVNIEKHLVESLESDSFFVGDDIQKKLQKAVLSLPEKQRVVFNLRYFDEMPYEDMSEVLNTSVGALKASYHHASKKIEKKLLDN